MLKMLLLHFLGTNDLQASKIFYNAVFKNILEWKNTLSHGKTVSAYKEGDTPTLALIGFTADAPTYVEGSQIALTVHSRKLVDKMHQAAMEQRGFDKGDPAQ